MYLKKTIALFCYSQITNCRTQERLFLHPPTKERKGKVKGGKKTAIGPPRGARALTGDRENPQATTASATRQPSPRSRPEPRRLPAVGASLNSPTQSPPRPTGRARPTPAGEGRDGEKDMGVGGSFWDLLKPCARHEGAGYLRGRRVAVDLSFWVVSHTTAIRARLPRARSPHLRTTFFRGGGGGGPPPPPPPPAFPPLLSLRLLRSALVLPLYCLCLPLVS
jgi:hypothetical protein